MKRFLSQTWLAPYRPYGKFALVGVLLFGALVTLKPAARSNANVPTVLISNQRLPEATAPARSVQRQEQERQISPVNYDLQRFPVTDKTEKHWRNILWTTAIVQPQEPFVAQAIDEILSLTSRTGLSNAQLRTIDAAARVGTQLYVSAPQYYSTIGQRFLTMLDNGRDPELVAVALSGLARGGLTPSQLQPLVSRVQNRFPNWSKSLPLQTTIREIATTIAPKPLPPLGDLLTWTIAPRQLHLYALCQPDRNVLCRMVVKNREGEFVRQSDGQLWSVPLLLRSIHHLSWNFVRGQTPQGIYRVEGEVPQPDREFFRAYGQFSLVNLYVPFESGAKQFLPGKAGPFRGTLADYQQLLPPSWRNHWGIQQSFWAGKIGRSEFRIHGSGEAPDFFSGKDKNPEAYPWNPTIGCLSALEIYNEKGQLVQADMPSILEVLRTFGGKNFAGYLVVVEVPGNSQQPISLTEIETAIASGKTSQRPSAPREKEQAQADPTPPAQTSLKPLPLSVQSVDQGTQAKLPDGEQGNNSVNPEPDRAEPLTLLTDILSSDMPAATTSSSP